MLEWVSVLRPVQLSHQGCGEEADPAAASPQSHETAGICVGEQSQRRGPTYSFTKHLAFAARMAVYARVRDHMLAPNNLVYDHQLLCVHTQPLATHIGLGFRFQI